MYFEYTWVHIDMRYIRRGASRSDTRTRKRASEALYIYLQDHYLYHYSEDRAMTRGFHVDDPCGSLLCMYAIHASSYASTPSQTIHLFIQSILPIKQERKKSNEGKTSKRQTPRIPCNEKGPSTVYENAPCHAIPFHPIPTIAEQNVISGVSISFSAQYLHNTPFLLIPRRPYPTPPQPSYSNSPKTPPNPPF